MKILVKIDQAAAIRAGIDAPRSTAQVEANPADLPQQERNILATILVDGHDATTRCVTLRNQELVATNTHPCWGIVLREPTFEALRANLGHIASEIVNLFMKQEAETQARDAKIDDAIAHPKENTETVRFDTSGDVAQWAGKVQREIRWIGVSGGDDPWASKEARARYDVAWRESQARRKAAIEAVLPSVREELSRLRDEEAKKAEQAKLAADAALILETARRAAIGALVAGDSITAIFPEDVERLREGLMPEEEQEAIAKGHLFYAFDLLEFPRYEKLTKADVPHDDGCCEPRTKFKAVPADSLSRAEYDVLRRIRIVAKEIEALDGVSSVKIKPRTHAGWCPNDDCEAGMVECTGAVVTVEWYGAAYSCELSLDAAEGEPAEPSEPSGGG